jgi:hypothetical protein
LISFLWDGQKPPRARRACARVLTNRFVNAAMKKARGG